MAYHPVASWIGAILFLAILMAGIVLFVMAIRLRLAQLKQAKQPDVRWDQVPSRLKNVMIYVLGQYRLPRNGYLYSGILHIFIFGAFVVLSVDTINFIVDGFLRIGNLVTGSSIPAQPFHLPFTETAYQALADTFRFLCIVGVFMAFVNRLVIKPTRLHLSRDAMYTLYFILGLMVFEVTQQGFQLAVQTTANGAFPPNSVWFSALFGQTVAGVDQSVSVWGYQISWFLHLATLVAFANYVPYSKHSHVFAAPINIFFMPLESKGKLSKMEFSEEAEYFGARSIEDFTWKRFFDGLSCTECGRCTDNCPASISEKPLKPMHIITDVKHHFEDRYKNRDQKIDLDEDDSLWLAGNLIDSDVLWSCTTCRACMEVCPVGNEHVPSIIDMRRFLTMTMGEVGHGASQGLKKMERAGNPWGMPKGDREDWASDMDVKKWDKDNPSDYLYWVGCAGAYDDRAKKVTRAVARLLTKGGVDFAILGNKERCTGDSARRLGDEYLFQSMAEENIGMLNEAGVKKIVTHCPHCLNTLNNEYEQFDGNYEVIHHSELLAKLLRDGKLKVNGASNGTGRVVYHDSCYLGRYNDSYDAQRAIIDSLPNVERVEADRNRQRGLCCGAGGGHMWMDMNIGERMNMVRTDELLKTDPKVIAVACNFCMTMIDDGVKARDREEHVKVLDLAEILDRHVA